MKASSRGDETKDKPEPEMEEATAAPTTASPHPKKRRGFAAMDRAAVRAIAHKGGIAAHARGTAHQFTTEEAREAGRKGGRAFHKVRGRKIRPSNGATEANGASSPA
jgi:general stress protein YciG